MNEALEKIFRLQAAGTTPKTECVAGLTTFMTMAYILAVNPSILGAAGMDTRAVLIATALSAALGTFLMAALANYPFALAPAMGLNAFFAFTVCGQMGYSWQVALLAVFIEGIVFILLTLTNVREAIFDAIPLNLKRAVSVGIGIFIAFIGLKNAHIIVDNPATFVALVNFREHWHTAGVSALLCLVGCLVIAYLMYRNVLGSMLLGIAATWLIGMAAEGCGIYVPDPAVGFYSVFPSSFISFDLSPLSHTFMQCFEADFSSVGIFNFIVILFSFLFVDLFDTIGTLVGVSEKAGFLDKDSKLPKVSHALMADAIATTAGALLGTSTVSSFVESAAGVGAGGRTGLASCVTGGIFLLAVVFSPIFLSIPAFAVAPALIITGYLMAQPVSSIAFDDPLEGVPAFLAIIFMPLAYSISEGLAAGLIAWTLLNLAAGKAKEKHIGAVMVLIVVFLLSKYVFM